MSPCSVAACCTRWRMNDVNITCFAVKYSLTTLLSDFVYQEYCQVESNDDEPDIANAFCSANVWVVVVGERAYGTGWPAVAVIYSSTGYLVG